MKMAGESQTSDDITNVSTDEMDFEEFMQDILETQAKLLDFVTEDSKNNYS